MVSQQGHTTRLAITGLGGVGKTQLAIELSYRIKKRYRGCSIIWIPATSLESLHQAYMNVAQQLSVPGWENAEADVKRLVQEYLSREQYGRWILIFDNADDISMWITRPTSGPGARRLIDYLPRSDYGCVIFTTRDRKAAFELAKRKVLEIPEMDEEIATQLLHKCLYKPTTDQAETSTLLKDITYLPIAIVQAAAYINKNGITVSEYLSLLAEQEEDVIDLLSEEFEDEGRYDHVNNPVAITWLISFEKIRHFDPLAAD